MNYYNRNHIAKKEHRKAKGNKFPKNNFGFHYDNGFAKKIKCVGYIRKTFDFYQFSIIYNENECPGEPSWEPRSFWLWDKNGYDLQVKKKSKKFHKQFIRWWKKNRLTN